mgnify:CR=1 FL=1
MTNTGKAIAAALVQVTYMMVVMVALHWSLGEVPDEDLLRAISSPTRSIRAQGE